MIAASATADEPIAGWDRARWGMSISEIQTAYPAAKPHKRETYDFGGRKYYSDLALSDIHVGGYNLTVQFLMDSSDTLAAVKLEKDFDKNMSGGKIAYETLKELLIQKYGPPTTEKSEPTEHSRSLSCIWHSPNAQIRLNYHSTPLIHLCFVNVTYAKPGDTDKL